MFTNPTTHGAPAPTCGSHPRPPATWSPRPAPTCGSHPRPPAAPWSGRSTTRPGGSTYGSTHGREFSIAFPSITAQEELFPSITANRPPHSPSATPTPPPSPCAWSHLVVVPLRLLLLADGVPLVDKGAAARRTAEEVHACVRGGRRWWWVLSGRIYILHNLAYPEDPPYCAIIPSRHIQQPPPFPKPVFM